ncbi:MAG: septum formation inhibitor Maf [Gammaproteobacteria bacterium]|nr:MAG: septum formation inhibitor Maf [Gammaproteobacteria bacterium]
MTPLAEIDLVLASTSRYRRELLERLTSHFRQESPQVDEAALPDEAPAHLAVRLAAAKARAVAVRHPNALVIGSDQVADCGGIVLGKPGNIANARRQLRESSGASVVFHTALCLIDARDATGREFAAIDTTRVVFRRLDDTEIERYLEQEQPFDCAGSFKSEGLGIGLFERIETVDPTALVGLPLIALCRLLREASVTAI